MKLQPTNPMGRATSGHSKRTGTIATLMFAGSTLLLSAPLAHAESGYLNTWINIYPNSQTDEGAGTGDERCKICHAASNQNLNPYGKACCDQGGNTAARLQAIENADSDADPTGSNNITEINAGTQMGWTTAAVQTYSRGNCNATGNVETAPSSVIGLLDPPPGNRPPVANDDTYNTQFQTQLTIAAPGVLANDTDDDFDTLTAALDTGPSFASSFNLSADGSFTYIPNIAFFGTDSFTYMANDGTDDSNMATVTINVGAGDADSDGVPDDADNCIDVPNGPDIPDAGGNSQLDTDGDGYGNMCDGDLNNDGDTNTLDLNLYKQAHRTSIGDPNYDADADFNGNGEINTLDLNIYKVLHRLPPGPSCCAP